MIHKDDVVKAGQLAKLRLRDDEVERLAADLERVVGYVEQLMSVDVNEVEPMIQPAALPCPRRKDEPGDVIGRRALAGSAGWDESGLVRVPKVIE